MDYLVIGGNENARSGLVANVTRFGRCLSNLAEVPYIDHRHFDGLALSVAVRKWVHLLERYSECRMYIHIPPKALRHPPAVPTFTAFGGERHDYILSNYG